MAGFAALKASLDADRARLESLSRWRRLRPQATPGASLDLAHNDYLNLRHDPAFRAKLAGISAALPPGATGSRLLGGEHPLFARLEGRFATFKEAESALYFPSGYAANEAVAQVLAVPGSAFFSDSLNHASMIDGIRLSAVPRERRQVFPHRDYVALESVLQASPAPLNVIFTESIYSMDGDLADLQALQDLAARHRGVLVIDEAHAIGVFGPKGRGAIAAAGLTHERLISVNTCGKALGVAGALVAGPAWFREALINRARSFIFTTAPSPWLAAALLCALERAAEMDASRAHLAALAASIRSGLSAMGFATGASATHIIPVLVGDDAAALAWEKKLESAGVLARAIRPPTVPVGTARLRLSLHAGLSADDAARILGAFREAP